MAAPYKSLYTVISGYILKSEIGPEVAALQWPYNKGQQHSSPCLTYKAVRTYLVQEKKDSVTKLNQFALILFVGSVARPPDAKTVGFVSTYV